MTWLKRTLPVSAVVHMGAALSLFLLPALSGDALPEPRRDPLTRFVLEGPPKLVPARPIVIVRGGGGGRSRGASPPIPAALESHALPPTMVDDPVGMRVEDVLDDPTPTGADVGEPGTDVGLSMGGDGSSGKNGNGDGSGPGQGPLRPGGDLEPPTKLRHVTPTYPELARRAGVQGVVVLECVIDPSGHVADVKVLRGHPLLEPAAVDAVRQWIYTATRLNGVPVAVLLTVTVRFTIPR
jgi:periplasmic protein TonB